MSLTAVVLHIKCSCSIVEKLFVDDKNNYGIFKDFLVIFQGTFLFVSEC